MENSDKSCRENANAYPGVIPANAGIQYAAPRRFNHSRLWNTGSPACAGDDTEGGFRFHPKTARTTVAEGAGNPVRPPLREDAGPASAQPHHPWHPTPNGTP